MSISKLFTNRFEVVPAPDGGFVIMLIVSHAGDIRQLSKAFTDVEDLILYLQSEAKALQEEKRQGGGLIPEEYLKKHLNRQVMTKAPAGDWKPT